MLTNHFIMLSKPKHPRSLSHKGTKISRGAHLSLGLPMHEGREFRLGALVREPHGSRGAEFQVEYPVGLVGGNWTEAN